MHKVNKRLRNSLQSFPFVWQDQQNLGHPGDTWCCFALKDLKGWRLNISPRQALLVFFIIFTSGEHFLLLNAWISLVTIYFCSASHNYREGSFVSFLAAPFTSRKLKWMVGCPKSAGSPNHRCFSLESGESESVSAVYLKLPYWMA